MRNTHGRFIAIPVLSILAACSCLNVRAAAPVPAVRELRILSQWGSQHGLSTSRDIICGIQVVRFVVHDDKDMLLVSNRLSSTTVPVAITLRVGIVTEFHIRACLKMKKLLALTLDHQQVASDVLQLLRVADSLKSLSVAYVTLDDSHFQQISHLSIEQLGLLGTRLTSSRLRSLVRIQSLWHLNLSSTNIDDTMLQSVGGLNLRILALDHTLVTAPGLARCRLMSRLHSLSIANCNQLGKSSVYLKSTTSLCELDVRHSVWTDEHSAIVGRIGKLQLLRVAGARLSAESLSTICRLPLLQDLTIEYSSIPLDGFQPLAGNRQLRHLGISGVQVGNQVGPIVLSLPNLVSFDCFGTGVPMDQLRELRHKRPWLTGDWVHLVRTRDHLPSQSIDR